jgi:hypothetical protein
MTRRQPIRSCGSVRTTSSATTSDPSSSVPYPKTVQCPTSLVRRDGHSSAFSAARMLHHPASTTGQPVLVCAITASTCFKSQPEQSLAGNLLPGAGREHQKSATEQAARAYCKAARGRCHRKDPTPGSYNCHKVPLRCTQETRNKGEDVGAFSGHACRQRECLNASPAPNRCLSSHASFSIGEHVEPRAGLRRTSDAWGPAAADL